MCTDAFKQSINLSSALGYSWGLFWMLNDNYSGLCYAHTSVFLLCLLKGMEMPKRQSSTSACAVQWNVVLRGRGKSAFAVLWALPRAWTIEQEMIHFISYAIAYHELTPTIVVSSASLLSSISALLGRWSLFAGSQTSPLSPYIQLAIFYWPTTPSCNP